jgi:hypothetical protein
LVGGNDKILPFFAGAMQNTSLLLDMALRNLQTKDVAHTLRKMGAAKIGEGAGPSNKNTVHFKEHGKSMFAVIESDDFGVPREVGIDEVRIAVGAVLAAGHPLEVLDRWSWDQLSLATEAITAYHAHLLTTVFSAITGSTPDKPKATPTSKAKHVDRSDLDAVKRAQARDAKIMAFAKGMGQRVDP